VSRRQKRFSRSLSLYFAIVALLPICAVSVLVVSYLRTATVAEAERKNLLLARSVGAQVEVFLREPQTVLQNLRTTILEERDGDAGDIEMVLTTHVLHSELFEAVYLLDARGHVTAAGLQEELQGLREDYLGLDLSHTEHYRRAMRTGKPTWSNTGLSLLTGKVSVALCLVVDDRALIGNFNFGTLSRFSRRLHVRDRLTVMIVDSSGDVIIHPDPEREGGSLNVFRLEPIRRALEGEEGTYRYILDGEDFLGSVASIPGPGWYALVSQRADVVLSPIRHTTYIMILGLMAACLLSIPVAFVLAGKFSRPLLDFTLRAKEIAAGRDTGTPAAESEVLEIGELSESFSSMATAVAERESRLRESEEKYRVLFENAHDAIFVVQDGKIPFANPRTEEMTGRSAAFLAENQLAEIIHHEDRLGVVERHARRLAGEDVQSSGTARILHTDGRTIWGFFNSVLIDWEGRPAVLNFVRDISEQKNLEIRAFQAQKLEAVGTLAGGIAHDFNNLLQTIQSYAEICLLGINEGGSMDEDLQEIVQAAQRGGELTRQLLLFSRKVDSRMRPLDLNEEVQRTARILKRILPRMIEIRLIPGARLSLVSADPSQIEQVLMNLAVNARDAMPDGGTLTIETKSLFLVATGGEQPVHEPGDYVVVSVSDTGTGIAEEDREHIFEPFYTTKEAGAGTGLGLAMAYGIVRNHNGYITCLNAPGGGTTFKFYLPALTRDELEEEAERVETPRGGEETLLLVDDEEPVLEVAEKILSTFGYKVLTARNGEEALEAFDSCAEEIDLVIIDMIMPGMGGMQALKELRRRKEGVRVLVSSGFAGGGTSRDVIDAGALGLIRKPYSVSQLLRVVRAALEGTLK
jgi:PAS domain S-box-containing protein